MHFPCYDNSKCVLEERSICFYVREMLAAYKYPLLVLRGKKIFTLLDTVDEIKPNVLGFPLMFIKPQNSTKFLELKSNCIIQKPVKNASKGLFSVLESFLFLFLKPQIGFRTLAKIGCIFTHNSHRPS